MNMLVFAPPPLLHQNMCALKKNLLFYFPSILGGKKEDLSTVISFFSALHGGNMKEDFWIGWAGWQAGVRML